MSDRILRLKDVPLHDEGKLPSQAHLVVEATSAEIDAAPGAVLHSVAHHIHSSRGAIVALRILEYIGGEETDRLLVVIRSFGFRSVASAKVGGKGPNTEKIRPNASRFKTPADLGAYWKEKQETDAIVERIASVSENGENPIERLQFQWASMAGANMVRASEKTTPLASWGIRNITQGANPHGDVPGRDLGAWTFPQECKLRREQISLLLYLDVPSEGADTLLYAHNAIDDPRVMSYDAIVRHVPHVRLRPVPRSALAFGAHNLHAVEYGEIPSESPTDRITLNSFGSLTEDGKNIVYWN